MSNWSVIYHGTHFNACSMTCVEKVIIYNIKSECNETYFFFIQSERVNVVGNIRTCLSEVLSEISQQS